ncbi:MAG: ABC transporter permease, partial [Candidatus Aminicenantes bacterium]|nr:ABC transporter permease [Candidatus Aminicenantes bacterium]
RDAYDTGRAAGLDEEAAFRSAVKQVGSADEIAAEEDKNRFVRLDRRSPLRPARFMPALAWNYAKSALRVVRRQKAYSFINIAGLAVGMAVCLLILLWVRDELSFDKFHANSHDIYRTIPELQGRKLVANPLALAKTFKNQYPEVRKITRYGWNTFLLKYGDKISSEDGAYVDDEFFKIFDFPLIKGTPETVFASVESIVLTERIAKKIFGHEDPMGKTVRADDALDLIVTGVMKDVPKNSHLQFDFLASMRLGGERVETSWSYEVATYALLGENVSIPEFEKKILGFVNEHDKRTNQKVLLHLQPLSQVHLYSLNGVDPILYVYVFLTIAVAILAIACINFINISTARSNTRAKEIGMRKVVGAVKPDIIRQFLGESFILSTIALLAAVGLVHLLLPAFNHIARKELTLDVAGDASTAILLLGTVLFTGLLSGSYPALLLSSFRPVTVLKQGRPSMRSGGFVLRRILVVGQFTATIVLLIGTIIMAKQLNYIRTKDIGLDRDHVVVVNLSRELRSAYPSLKSEIKQNPNVVNVSSARRLPTQIGHSNPAYWEGKGPADYVIMTDACVDYDYFETLGMTILEGRSFAEEFPTDAQNYILNEEALKVTGLKDPIGKMFSCWEDEGVIIGIVKNFHESSLHNVIGPVFFTLSQRHGRRAYLFVKIRPDDVPGTIAFLREKVAQFGPNTLFEYRFMDETFNEQYANDERRGEIYKYFTILAIFVSCLGLFGMASFSAEQRTREIGIRKVLGASVTKIIALISKDFVVLLAVSNLIAWPAAYYLMDRLLKSYAYRTGLAAWIFVAAGAGAALIALATVCFRIVRAAHANPVDSLRYE